MDDTQLTRYSRHIFLPEIDFTGQEKLLASRVLVVGLGGLGSPASMYLAAAGVGRLILCDDDRVDLGNLQRQIIHGTDDVGRLKVESAQDTLRAINPALNIITLERRLDPSELRAQMQTVDVVLDCSDNFATRFALNDAALATGTPLVIGAAIRFRGQVLTIDPRLNRSPCYRCLYPEEGVGAGTCSQNGVFAPLVGVIGSLQAAEAAKVIIGIAGAPAGQLLIYDALLGTLKNVALERDPACPACNVAATSGRGAK